MMINCWSKFDAFPYIACCLFLLPDYNSLPWKNQLHWSHLSQYQNAEYTNNSKMCSESVQNWLDQ